MIKINENEFNKAVDAKVEVNSYKPPQAREVMEDHPVIQMGEAAAKSVEETAAAVVAEAKALQEACANFADDLRKGAKEIADRASFILKKIHAAGKQLQAAREDYLNNKIKDPGSDAGTSHTMPPKRPLPDRQQPGATAEHGS